MTKSAVRAAAQQVRFRAYDRTGQTASRAGSCGQLRQSYAIELGGLDQPIDVLFRRGTEQDTADKLLAGAPVTIVVSGSTDDSRLKLGRARFASQGEGAQAAIATLQYPQPQCQLSQTSSRGPLAGSSTEPVGSLIMAEMGAKRLGGLKWPEAEWPLSGAQCWNTDVVLAAAFDPSRKLRRSAHGEAD